MHPRCCIPGCGLLAAVEVFLYDVYPEEQMLFFEQDMTCPYLCWSHLAENEEEAQGERKPRGYVQYPYTNRQGALGWSIYREL